MNTVYLQCDCRFNKWLFEKIDNRYVLEHTIFKCKAINASEIVAGIYLCPENERLINLLDTYDIKCILSNEDHVNKRFLQVIKKLYSKYIVRVGGDQVLTDVDKVNMILSKINEDWFYEEISAGVIPDIVGRQCIIDHYEELVHADRYFDVLFELADITKYQFSYPLYLPFDFRVNSEEGFRICKNVIEKQLDIYEITGWMIKRMKAQNSYLMKSGLLGSWIIPNEKADFYYEDGKVNPWFAKTMVDFIKKHLNCSLDVFEWGSGNSTLFWSQYVDWVISVEHDKEWYKKMKQSVPENVELRMVDLIYGGEYCKEILNTDRYFDIVLIDGRDRVRCAKNSVKKLTSKGVIIWDDTEREYYKEGYEYLKDEGFKKLELNGIKYGSPDLESYTSIFYREENIFDL